MRRRRPDVKARADILGHVRRLVAEQGHGVGHHLFDEIIPSDDLVVLHLGRVLAHGPVAHHRRHRTQDINASFKSLTENAAESGASP
jgi:ABC-2 type transport system ATP-binding protein